MPTIEEKYARLLEHFEGLEKKLKDSGYIVVEESELLPGFHLNRLGAGQIDGNLG